MTTDRLIHLIVGIVFLLIFIKPLKIKTNKKILIYAFISMSLGTWIPDWDLFLGIGFHRSPITHSLLPALVLSWFIYKYKFHPILIIGFSLGLSSHLFWDIIAYGNVQWIPGGNNDRLFLLVNGVALIFASLIMNKKVPNK